MPNNGKTRERASTLQLADQNVTRIIQIYKVVSPQFQRLLEDFADLLPYTTLRTVLDEDIAPEDAPRLLQISDVQALQNFYLKYGIRRSYQTQRLWCQIRKQEFIRPNLLVIKGTSVTACTVVLAHPTPRFQTWTINDLPNEIIRLIADYCEENTLHSFSTTSNRNRAVCLPVVYSVSRIRFTQSATKMHHRTSRRMCAATEKSL